MPRFGASRAEENKNILIFFLLRLMSGGTTGGQARI